MTVRELIDALTALDAPNARVFRTDPTGHEGMNDIHRVELLGFDYDAVEIT